MEKPVLISDLLLPLLQQAHPRGLTVQEILTALAPISHPQIGMALNTLQKQGWQIATAGYADEEDTCTLTLTSQERVEPKPSYTIKIAREDAGCTISHTAKGG